MEIKAYLVNRQGGQRFPIVALLGRVIEGRYCLFVTLHYNDQTWIEVLGPDDKALWQVVTVDGKELW